MKLSKRFRCEGFVGYTPFETCIYCGFPVEFKSVYDSGAEGGDGGAVAMASCKGCGMMFDMVDFRHDWEMAIFGLPHNRNI